MKTVFVLCVGCLISASVGWCGDTHAPVGQIVLSTATAGIAAQPVPRDKNILAAKRQQRLKRMLHYKKNQQLKGKTKVSDIASADVVGSTTAAVTISSVTVKGK